MLDTNHTSGSNEPELAKRKTAMPIDGLHFYAVHRRLALALLASIPVLAWWLVDISLLGSNRHAMGQPPLANSSGTLQWLAFSDCPVLLERTVEVPALESGVLEKLEIELNSSVVAGQVLGTLDNELAMMELKIAKLQHTAALELAQDQSNVQFSKVVLREAQEELDNFAAIKSSVAGSEIRRLTLAVGRAEVDVQRAEQTLKRYAVEAELKGAAVGAANLRLNRRRIETPISGVVTAIHHRAGQWVEAGKPVALVANLEHLLVDCLIPLQKIDLKRVIGLEVRIESQSSSPNSAPIRLAGKISSYDPQVSSQGLVRVHAKIQNAQREGHWLLLPGMNVKLEVAVDAAEPALISRQRSQQR